MGKSSFTVHVPATTANLGPGFDCLGLALDLWNKVSFSKGRNGIVFDINGEGEDELPRDETNLIYQAASHLALKTGKILPVNLNITCENKIPTSSGLGSSAGAIIGGMVAAMEMLDIEITQEKLVQEAAQIERHADNVSACFHGGLVLVRSEKKQFHIRQYEIKPLSAIIAVPDYFLPTLAARKALPKNIPYSDAVFNITRCAELIDRFQSGNYTGLQAAMEDKIHQPYRFPLLPGAKEAILASQSAGAYGACLSGAGPAVIAFSDKHDAQKIGNSMQASYRKMSINSRLFILDCPTKGCYID